MSVEIRETSVVKTREGDAVHLHISDELPDQEGVSFVLDLHAVLPGRANPLLVELQRDAMKTAQEHLSELLRLLAQQAQERD